MAEPWNASERQITPEKAVLSRRQWLKWAGLGAVGLAAGGGVAWWRYRGTDREVLAAGQPSSPVALGPTTPDRRFTDAGRPLTDETAAARYCNFYEFTSTKSVWRHVERFTTEPWTVAVTGLVARPFTFDIDKLSRLFPRQQRIYRHRCVEAWAMVVPWIGFPLADLLRHVEPLPAARYVRFTSFDRPDEADHMRDRSLPWPYTESLTLAEATNELAFVATGMYGHGLLKQHGAPLRVVLPWKYGFKSAKSIVRIELTATQPATFWNTMSPREYDFTANVNPQVDHPRWSQRTERMLDTGDRYLTMMYNGYGEWVARLYP